MRKLTRVCRDHYADESWGLWCGVFPLVLLCKLYYLSSAWMFCTGGVSQMKQKFAVNLWLTLLVTAAWFVWYLLRNRWWVHAVGWSGLLLATFGLVCRIWCDAVLYGVYSQLAWGGTHYLESHAPASVAFLIAVHRWGGLVAIAVGLYIAFVSARVRERDRRIALLR